MRQQFRITGSCADNPNLAASGRLSLAFVEVRLHEIFERAIESGRATLRQSRRTYPLIIVRQKRAACPTVGDLGGNRPEALSNACDRTGCAAYDAFYRALTADVSIFNVTSLLSMEELTSTTKLPIVAVSRD